MVGDEALKQMRKALLDVLCEMYLKCYAINDECKAALKRENENGK